MGDAIARTLVRLFITHRHLLEWVPAAQAAIGHRLDIVGLYRAMAAWLGWVVLALAAPADRAREHGHWRCRLLHSGSRRLAVGSRGLADLPGTADQMPATAAESQALRTIARRTWRYFETFVTAADHTLPPDNFQEDPAPALAHRTSPTNVGLHLLGGGRLRFRMVGDDGSG